MGLVTVVGSMTASAALVLGVVYFSVWLRPGGWRAFICFSLVAFSVTALAATVWFARDYFRARPGAWP